MLRITQRRAEVPVSPARINEDCRWACEPLDDCGLIYDWMPDGSVPMTPWEEMLIRFAPIVVRPAARQCQYCEGIARPNSHFCEGCAEEVAR